MKKVLVTGADGFIGSYILKRLKENKEYKILVTPRHSQGFDVSDKKSVLGLPKADIVIHLAGIVSVPDSWEYPHKTMEINTIGTLNMLLYCQKHNSSIIYASTYAYGVPKKLPIDENQIISAQNPYAVSKIAAEMLVEVYSTRYNFPACALRIFNPYGPGQPTQMIISQMINELVVHKKITIFSGKPKRDFIFVTDVADAFMSVLSNMPSGFSVYNLGSGKSWSIKQIAEMLIKISNLKIKIKDKGIERPNEILNTVADIGKIKHDLGWTPKVDILDGLRLVYEEIQNKKT